ncbi:hypothetical protein MKW92_035842 [Papaver armeniacum]|nr:hypothetical protein MKW92_035842 [Papaver armeniacum]
MGKENKGIVCVTGGAGYFASWLIKRLLERGYTVRPPSGLTPSLPEASGDKLQVFIADLERPESFEDVIDGCIVYSMSLILLLILQEKLEDFKGMLEIQNGEKVIYTSSAVAALFISNKKDVEEINENMWSEVDTLRERGKRYPLSKTLTERAMFQFAEQHGLDLVSVLPSMIVGVFLTSSLPLSLKISQALVLEHCNLLSTINNAVHIDDAASAHIFLFECSNAKGRCICSSADITVHDIAKFISVKYPELELPTELLVETEEEKPIHLSSDKLLNCGFSFKYNFEDMYTDAIQEMEGEHRNDQEGTGKIVCNSGWILGILAHHEIAFNVVTLFGPPFGPTPVRNQYL